MENEDEKASKIEDIKPDNFGKNIGPVPQVFGNKESENSKETEETQSEDHMEFESHFGKYFGPNKEDDDEDNGNNSNNEVTISYGEIEETTDIVERKFSKFKNFQVSDYCNPYDHKFTNPNENKDMNINRLRNSNIIFREWYTLEIGLPKSIFVRAYKSRFDIARAIIVGPEGTLYNNTLFLFDILFPSNYPNYPPHLSYRSYGLELQPYLFCDGNVNDSLLNEGWNPKESNLLQVLVSIQKQLLILGNCGNQCEALSCDKNDYSDKDYKLMGISVAMMNILSNPPWDFENYVKGFYRTRSHSILSNYKACLAEFKGSDDELMKKIFFNLIKEFEKNGSYCKHHYSEEELKEALKDEKEESEKYYFGSSEDSDDLDQKSWKLSEFVSKMIGIFKFRLMKLLMKVRRG